MSSLELNKIVAAILLAGVVAMSSGFFATLLTHPQVPDQPVYLIAGTEGGEETAAAAEDSGPEPVLALLASADPEVGQGVSRKCTACHTFEEGGANKIGPNLWNIVNSGVAAVDGFGYSGALEERASEVWDYDNLNAFLAKPSDWAPGTKMSFAGLRKVEDRAAIIAYMRGYSTDPAPLPSPEEAAASEEPAAEEPAAETPTEEAPADQATSDDQAAEGAGEDAGATQQAAAPAGATTAGLAAMVATVEVDAAKKVSRKCTACHTFEQGAKNKIGPNLYGIIGRNVGAVEGFKYSAALTDKAGEIWSYENLLAYLENPKKWAPGTKMTFAGLRKPEDRAAIIAFLRTYHDDPPAVPE